jgi:hypothetical protein
VCLGCKIPIRGIINEVNRRIDSICMRDYLGRERRFLGQTVPEDLVDRVSCLEEQSISECISAAIDVRDRNNNGNIPKYTL